MNRAVIGAIFAVIIECLSFQPAFAMGPECAGLFAPSSENFQRSEQFRLVILSNANDALKLIRIARLSATSQFQLEIEGRDQTGWSRISRSMETSPTLSNLDMRPSDKDGVLSITPPTISSKTMDMMQDVNADLAKVAETMRKDAYFAWLKHEGLRYQMAQKDNLAAINGGLRAPYDQADPVALFIQSRKEGMNPDISLIRVMRNMDPVISAKAFDNASGALYYNAIEGVLLDKIIPIVRDRKPGADDIWLLMPSLGEGRANLRKVLDRQSEKYGRLVPRAAYERILMRVHAISSDLNVIHRYRAQRRRGMSEQEILNENMSSLLLFAEQVGLAKDFPIERLYDLVDRIDTFKTSTSYESVLADIFDPNEAKTIRELRFLTETALGMSSMAQADAYLRTLVEP